MTKRKRYLILVGLLSVSSFLLTLDGYGALKGRYKSQVLLSGILTKDKSTFELHYEGRCIGLWEGQLTSKEKGGHRYKGKGSLNVIQSANTFKVKATLLLAFNELDQLGASIFQFWNATNPRGKVTIGSSGTNPLTADVVIPRPPETPFTLKASLPGPFTLSPVEDETFGIQSPSSQLPLKTPAFIERFSIVKAKSPEEACKLKSDHGLDITKLSQNIFSDYQSFLPNTSTLTE